MKMIKDNDVKYVDFRFTDPRGKWQHVTFDISHDRGRDVRRRPDVRRLVDRRLEGDQRVRHVPDAGSGHPPASIRSSPRRRWSLVCDVLEPTTGEPYNRDPRGIAKKAEGMVKSHGRRRHHLSSARKPSSSCSTTCKYTAEPYNTGFKLDSVELPINSDTEYEGGNLGHRIGTKKGYFPVPPQDSVQDMRSEMLAAMAQDGRAWSRSTTTKWPPPSTSSA